MVLKHLYENEASWSSTEEDPGSEWAKDLGGAAADMETGGP